MLTGEPVPVEKRKDSRVVGGTLNGNGSLLMRAEKVGSETMLAQIVQMVSQAQRSRAPLFSDWLMWFPHGLFRPSSWLPYHFFGLASYRSSAGVGLRVGQRCGGAHHCVPLCAWPGYADVDHGGGRTRCQHGRALQGRLKRSRVLGRVTALVVDKTGTLTEGRPSVTSNSAAR